MSVRHNDRGRSYAQCDGPADVHGPMLCGANIIDLSRRLDEAARCARTFFGWSTSLTPHGWVARCPRCRTPEPVVSRNRPHYPGGFRRAFTSKRGLNNARSTDA